VRVSQPNSHTASPEPTAPERAVRFWNELVARCATLGRPSDGGDSPGDSPAISHSFDSLTPTLMAMSSGNDGLEDTATLQIGMRLPPGVTPEAVQDEVRALLPDGVFGFAQGEPAVRGEKNSPLAAAFLRSIRLQGGKPRIKVKTGTSDMNVVGPAWGCSMLAYGPGDSRLDHTPNEHIEIDDYLRGIKVLTHVLAEL
jgi:LysW-gamma-L-lysine carboxypeptidase